MPLPHEELIKTPTGYLQGHGLAQREWRPAHGHDTDGLWRTVRALCDAWGSMRTNEHVEANNIALETASYEQAPIEQTCVRIAYTGT